MIIRNKLDVFEGFEALDGQIENAERFQYRKIY